MRSLSVCLSMILMGGFTVGLWELQGAADSQKPLGGDGSDGTTEEPIVSDQFGNSMRQLWSQLDEEERQVIVDAWERNV